MAGTFHSAVYTVPDEEAAVGVWKEESPLADIGPDDPTIREGCKSSLRGASYATSEVTVTKDRVESFDRGFEADGKQVCGATKGAYVFLKTDDVNSEKSLGKNHHNLR